LENSTNPANPQKPSVIDGDTDDIVHGGLGNDTGDWDDGDSQTSVDNRMPCNVSP
jgi:hypothetical protein